MVKGRSDDEIGEIEMGTVTRTRNSDWKLAKNIQLRVNLENMKMESYNARDMTTNSNYDKHGKASSDDSDSERSSENHKKQSPDSDSESIVFKCDPNCKICVEYVLRFSQHIAEIHETRRNSEDSVSILYITKSKSKKVCSPKHPFRCAVCNKRFKKSRGLKTHSKRHKTPDSQSDQESIVESSELPVESNPSELIQVEQIQDTEKIQRKRKKRSHGDSTKLPLEEVTATIALENNSSELPEIGNHQSTEEIRKKKGKHKGMNDRTTTNNEILETNKAKRKKKPRNNETLSDSELVHADFPEDLHGDDVSMEVLTIIDDDSACKSEISHSEDQESNIQNSSEATSVLKSSRPKPKTLKKCLVAKLIANSKLQTNKTSSHNCEFCQETFSFPVGLKRHYRQVHPEQYATLTPLPPKRKNFKWIFKHFQHLKNDHSDLFFGGKAYVCRLCNVSLPPSYGIFRRHFRKEHPGQMPYGCKICPKLFGCFEKLIDHDIKCHTPDRRFRCINCKEEFNLFKKLGEHMNSEHPGLTCEICQKKFRGMSMLNVHKATHKNK